MQMYCAASSGLNQHDKIDLYAIGNFVRRNTLPNILLLHTAPNV